MKLMVVIITGVALLAITAWLIQYHNNLIPTLVLVKPANECEDLTFGASNTTYGAKVEKYLANQHNARHPVFAIKGRSVVRFVPDQFHGVHGMIETKEANNDEIYFYSYHERYRPIVEQP